MPAQPARVARDVEFGYISRESARRDYRVVLRDDSSLDIEATARTLDIVREVRASRRTALRAMIVPNRVDQRTLEGQQFIEELDTFGEEIGPMIGSRSAYVRAFALGQSVADFAGGTPADIEIKTLADLVMSWSGIAPRQRVTI